MSGSGTIYTEQSVLGHTLGFKPMAFPAQVFVGLCAAAMPPSETVQGIEAFGGGYARMPATFALIDTPANIAANVASIEWPIATAGWGTLGFFEVWSAASGGNRLYWGPLIDTTTRLPTTITVSSGDIARFSAGTLAVQAATGTDGTGSVGAYLPLAGGTLTGPLALAADPTTLLGAATKQYVDAHSGTGGGPGFLPLSGGTMLGTLTLAGAPTASGHAATKAYVDSGGAGQFLPLSGGTITGPTTVTIATSTSAAANSLQVILDASGPAGPSVALGSRTNTSALTTPANRGAVPILANISTAIKMAPTGGVPGGQQLPEQWTYISQNYDCTNLPSSAGGALLNEYDTAANGADDGSQRAGAVYVYSTIWPIGAPPTGQNPAYGPPPAVGGLPAEFASAMSFTASPDVVLKRGLVMALPYSTSLIDTRLGSQPAGTIQTTASAGSTSLHVNNLVSYLSWGPNGSPVSAGNPMPVTIGANSYSVAAAVFDAPVAGVTTDKGTLTLASGILGTDGAAGNNVVAAARTIWLADGQQIAFSTAGDVYAVGGGGQLTIKASAFVEVAGELLVSGQLSCGNMVGFGGTVSLGSTTAPSTPAQYFHSSGNTGADVGLAAAGGTGALDGNLTFQGKSLIFAVLPSNYANDAAAQAGGIAVGGVYRNGSALMVRVS